MLGGVSAGLGTYLGIDPVFIRLMFVVLALADGIALFIYILLWILVPLEPAAGGTSAPAALSVPGDLAQRAGQLGSEAAQAVTHPHPQAGLWLGGALILAGGVLFLRSLGFTWLSWLDSDVLWPLLLVVGGLVLILRRREES
jgi:phage shock protein PspC (stress-responsive transcriptional regulator)